MWSKYVPFRKKRVHINATECVCPIELKRQSCKSNIALEGMENVSPLGLVTLTQLTALGLP